jgi:uncharacterized protein
MRSICLIGWSCMAAALFGGTGATLPDAAQRGDQEQVKLLLEHNADVNATQGDGMTALHWAAYLDNLPLTQMLLSAGARVSAVTRLGSITPLFFACSNGSAAVADALLRAGADVNATKDAGTTPLMVAASSGSAELVRLLLAHGADVNIREAVHGQTALMFAAASNRPEVVQLLVAHGADSAIATNVTKVGRGANANNGLALEDRIQGATAMGGMTALLFAARDGHIEAVQALVNAGADVNQASSGENTSPLLIAIINGHYVVAQYLLDHGADPNIANTAGLAPLYATIDVQWAPLGWFPNPIVAQEKVSYLDLMRALLERGANPDARLGTKLWFRPLTHELGWVSPVGATPFWRSAQANDIAAMRLLVDHGANAKLAAASGDTPLMMAAGVGWRGNFTITAPDTWLAAVQYCIDLGIDINAKDDKGYTALHGAAYRGSNEVVRLLAKGGADPHVIAKNGDSPADMAFGPERYGIPHPDTVALLVKLGSPFQNSCRSDQCLPPPRADKKKSPTPSPAQGAARPVSTSVDR